MRITMRTMMEFTWEEWKAMLIRDVDLAIRWTRLMHDPTGDE